MFQLVRYVLYFLVPAIIGLLTYQYLNQIFFVPYKPGSQRTALVEVTAKGDLSDLCELLVKKKVIRQTQSLCLYKQLRGDSRPIVPGEYKLSPGMTPAEILESLQSGDLHLRSFEIPVGSTIWSIDEQLTELGLFDRHEFETAATNPELLTRAGIAASSFEGYLAPGSYAYSKGVKPATVLWDMLERGEKDYWNQKYSQRLEILRMSRHELLTLASIIYKTSSNNDERLLVSSVLHNRLKNGMKLQSEVALSYAIRDFDGGPLSDQDKSLPSPYNTFLNYGLPPGPIVNSDLVSIEAALNPPESEYLFYGKSVDGRMVFATTLKEFREEIGGE